MLLCSFSTPSIGTTTNLISGWFSSPPAVCSSFCSFGPSKSNPLESRKSEIQWSIDQPISPTYPIWVVYQGGYHSRTLFKSMESKEWVLCYLVILFELLSLLLSQSYSLLLLLFLLLLLLLFLLIVIFILILFVSISIYLFYLSVSPLMLAEKIQTCVASGLSIKPNRQAILDAAPLTYPFVKMLRSIKKVQSINQSINRS